MKFSVTKYCLAALLSGIFTITMTGCGMWWSDASTGSDLYLDGYYPSYGSGYYPTYGSGYYPGYGSAWYPSTPPPPPPAQGPSNPRPPQGGNPGGINRPNNASGNNGGNPGGINAPGQNQGNNGQRPIQNSNGSVGSPSQGGFRGEGGGGATGRH